MKRDPKTQKFLKEIEGAHHTDPDRIEPEMLPRLLLFRGYLWRDGEVLRPTVAGALLLARHPTAALPQSRIQMDVLQRAGWVKRALFLADRIALVNQACNAFKTHLPESSPVNLVTDKDTEGRVYVCTYPTMMSLIDETKGGEARFGVGAL